MLKSKTLNLFQSDRVNSLSSLFCHALITWFELSRVKLCRNDLEGNKNNFELAGGSSYRGFELPRVK